MSLSGGIGEERFFSLRVVSAVQDTDLSVILELAPQSSDAWAFRRRPGQHLTVRRLVDGREFRRSYAIFNPPTERTLALCVKATPGGAVSPWLAGLRVGDMVEASAPYGNFTVVPDATRRRHYIAFAGGVGVAPILSIAAHLLDAEPESRVTLVYDADDGGGIMLLEAVKALKDRRLERFALHIPAIGGDGGADGGVDGGGEGEEHRICRLSRLHDFLSGGDELYLVCGPGPVVAGIRSALLDLGVPSDAVMSEFFSAPAPAAAKEKRRSPRSRRSSGNIVYVGQERRWTCAYDPARGSILNNLLSAGAPVSFSCKTAVCGACRARVTAGEVDMRRSYALHPADVASGYVLLCQSFPVTDELVVEAGE